jgi:hypothetical protein
MIDNKEKEILNDFLEVYFKYNPTIASQYGHCKYDDLLEDYTRDNLNREFEDYDTFLKKYLNNKEKLTYKILKGVIKKRVYEITIWNKPFQDPNHYFNKLVSSVIWITDRPTYKLINYNKTMLPKRLKKMEKFIKTISENITDNIPKEYLNIFKKSIPTIEYLNIPKKEKTKLINLLNNEFEKIKKLPNKSFSIGLNNLKKLFVNSEHFDIDITKIYKYSLKHHANIIKKFYQEIDNLKVMGKNIYEKISNYEKNYHQSTLRIDKFITSVTKKLNAFISKNKIIDISFLKNPLDVSISKMFHMTINEMTTCVDSGKPESLLNYHFNKHNKNKRINLYVNKSDNSYNMLSYINTVVHEYTHYIQYEKDRSTDNILAILFNSISTGEGVAHFFEEYIVNKGFMNKEYLFYFYYFQIYKITRFIVGYELQTGMLTYKSALKRFEELSIYKDKEGLEYEVDNLVYDTYTMEYYLGKYLIEEHIRKYPDFDVNNLFTYGSIPLKFIFELTK